jgi:hypothetical protein
MTNTAIDEVLADIGDFVACMRMEDEAYQDFAGRILVHIRERAELLAECHAEVLQVLGEEVVAGIDLDLLDYAIIFAVPPWAEESCHA